MESSMNIGQRNVDVAKEVLAQNNIKIIAENIGGSVGRKLRFDSGNGQVMMKFLNKSDKK
jgi:chemotaxis protein CheD